MVTVFPFLWCGEARAGAFGKAGKESLVTSQPTDAMVFLDDNYVGQTPTQLSSRISGKHLLKITRHGFIPVVAAIEIGDTPQTWHFKLEEAFGGSLQVVSDPAGADVWLNSQNRGMTPLVLDDLPVGPHDVRVERRSYEPWTGSVEIVADELSELNITLPMRQEVYYRQKMEAEPNNSTLPFELAHIRLIKGDLDEAARLYKKALEIHHSGKDKASTKIKRKLHQELGLISTPGKLNYGDEETVKKMSIKICEILEELTREHPELIQIHELLAGQYRRIGMYLESGEVYERLYESNPGNISSSLKASMYYSQAQAYDKAISILKKTKAKHDKNYVVHERLGKVYKMMYQKGNKEAKQLAIEAFRRSANLCRDRSTKRRIENQIKGLTAQGP